MSILGTPVAIDPTVLESIREQICCRSGRYELVGLLADGQPDYSVDAGVDAFIDNGFRMMADRLERLVGRATKAFAVFAGQQSVPLEGIRTIDRVAWRNSLGVRTWVHNRENRTIEDYNMTEDDVIWTGTVPALSTVDLGVPTYWDWFGSVD